MAGSALVSTPSRAEEPGGAEVPSTPGTGLVRDYPVPVPDHLPRRNLVQPSAEGGVIAPWMVFLNFDGATLTAGGDSAQDDITQIAELAGEFAPYDGDASMRTSVIQAVEVDFAEYNIDIVDTRPESGEYAMTLVGPTNPFGGGVLGIAPVDCGNQQTHSNVSFAFTNLTLDPITTASTISHELGHSFGLDHVNEMLDLLNPSDSGGDPEFLDQCLPLTDGAFAACGPVHEQHCPGEAAQNGHQELLSLFGPAIPDVDGPVVIMTAPLTGTTFEEGDGFTVLVTITDDSDVVAAELFSNGVSVSVDTTEPWGWQIGSLPAGLYTLEVVAHDEHGNEGLSTPVSILVGDGGAGGSGGLDDDSGGVLDGDSGSEDGDTETAGADEDAEGCGCAQTSPQQRPWLAGLAVLVLLGLRRRRARA